jgi:hypothetical protein
MKKIFLTAIIFSFVVKPKAQKIDQSKDTVYIDKVLLCDQLLERKTNRVLKTWFYHKKVKSGYIVNNHDGYWLVNDKLLKYHEDENGSITFSK